MGSVHVVPGPAPEPVTVQYTEPGPDYVYRPGLYLGSTSSRAGWLIMGAAGWWT